MLITTLENFSIPPPLISTRHQPQIAQNMENKAQTSGSMTPGSQATQCGRFYASNGASPNSNEVSAELNAANFPPEAVRYLLSSPNPEPQAPTELTQRLVDFEAKITQVQSQVHDLLRENHFLRDELIQLRRLSQVDHHHRPHVRRSALESYHSNISRDLSDDYFCSPTASPIQDDNEDPHHHMHTSSNEHTVEQAPSSPHIVTAPTPPPALFYPQNLYRFETADEALLRRRRCSSTNNLRYSPHYFSPSPFSPIRLSAATRGPRQSSPSWRTMRTSSSTSLTPPPIPVPNSYCPCPCPDFCPCYSTADNDTASADTHRVPADSRPLVSRTGRQFGTSDASKGFLSGQYVTMVRDAEGKRERGWRRKGIGMLSSRRG